MLTSNSTIRKMTTLKGSGRNQGKVASCPVVPIPIILTLSDFVFFGRRNKLFQLLSRPDPVSSDKFLDAHSPFAFRLDFKQTQDSCSRPYPESLFLV